MRLPILTGLVLASILVACGGTKSSSNEWARHDIPEAEASISVPPGWRVLTDFDPKTIADFSDENAKFAPYVEPLIENDVFKLFAIDPDMREAFATNLNVIVAQVGAPLREWVAEENATSRKLAVPGSFRSAFVRMPAGEAARSSSLLEVNAGGRKRTVRVLQFMFERDATGYVLTFTTLPTLATTYQAAFARSARSFRFD